MEPLGNGATVIAMETMITPNGATPYYEDESTNIYETIPMDYDDDEEEEEDACENPSKSPTVLSPGETSSSYAEPNYKRVSNEYVSPDEMHA